MLNKLKLRTRIWWLRTQLKVADQKCRGLSVELAIVHDAMLTLSSELTRLKLVQEKTQ